MTTDVRVPKHAKDLRLGDRLAGCPDGCQCTPGYHSVHHLRIDPVLYRGAWALLGEDGSVTPTRGAAA